MAIVNVRQHRVRQFGNTPYGQYSAIKYGITTGAAGFVNNAGLSAGTTDIGDVIVIGTLQQDQLLIDSQTIVKVAMTAAVTGSLGFRYSDGVDDATVPQDAAYFGTGLVLNATGLLRKNTAKLVKLPKEAQLILTIAGAANAKVSEIDFIIMGELGSPQ